MTPSWSNQPKDELEFHFSVIPQVLVLKWLLRRLVWWSCCCVISSVAALLTDTSSAVGAMAAIATTVASAIQRYSALAVISEKPSTRATLAPTCWKNLHLNFFNQTKQFKVKSNNLMARVKRSETKRITTKDLNELIGRKDLLQQKVILP